VTGHWLSEEFTLGNCVLAMRPLSESHTSDNILATVKNVIASVGYTGIVTSKTHDNAANMVNAMQPDRANGIEGESIRCAAHTLNLVVQDALDNSANGVTEIRQKCRDLITHFNHSSTSSAALRERQSAAGETPKKLRADVATRWNSFYLALERVNLLKVFS
jgi:hypothetical protein